MNCRSDRRIRSDCHVQHAPKMHSARLLAGLHLGCVCDECGSEAGRTNVDIPYNYDFRARHKEKI
jgi:hypothetical protein